MATVPCRTRPGRTKGDPSLMLQEPTPWCPSGGSGPCSTPPSWVFLPAGDRRRSFVGAGTTPCRLDRDTQSARAGAECRSPRRVGFGRGHPGAGSRADAPGVQGAEPCPDVRSLFPMPGGASSRWSDATPQEWRSPVHCHAGTWGPIAVRSQSDRNPVHGLDMETGPWPGPRAGPVEIGRSTASASPRVRPTVVAYPDIAPLRSLIRIRSTADLIWKKEIHGLAQVILKLVVLRRGRTHLARRRARLISPSAKHLRVGRTPEMQKPRSSGRGKGG
jgi:hypothetical protein